MHSYRAATLTPSVERGRDDDGWSGVSTVAFPLLFNCLDPEFQSQILALRVSDAGPHLLVPGTKSLDVERNGIGEVKDVFAVSLAVAPELREGQVVGIEG